MKRFLDIIAVLPPALFVFCVVDAFAIADKIGKLTSKPLVGFGPWQVELMIFDIFPMIFSIVWFSLRVSALIANKSKII